MRELFFLTMHREKWKRSRAFGKRIHCAQLFEGGCRCTEKKKTLSIAEGEKDGGLATNYAEKIRFLY